MPYYLLLVIACLLASCTATQSTTTTNSSISNVYENTYDAYVGEDETKVHSWYQGVNTTRGQEAYIVRLFHPEKKQITSLKTFLYNDHSVLNGLAIEWLDNGIKKSEGNYKVGVKHGLWKHYHENGKLESEVNWFYGKKQGLYNAYDTLGQEAAIYMYEANERSETIKETATFLAQQKIKKELMPCLLQSMDIADEKERIIKSESLLRKHIYSNITYPKFAIMNKVVGTAIIRFTITEEGETEEVYAVSGICESIEKEAIRIVKLLPAWNPVIKDGKPTRTAMRMPIRFKLD